MAHYSDIIEALGANPSPRDTDGVVRAMVSAYLVDWKSAVDTGKQLSNVVWKKSGSLPMSDEILIGLTGGGPRYRQTSPLSIREMETIVSIRKKIDGRSLDKVIDLAFSTYPMIASEEGRALNLNELSIKYKRDFHNWRDRIHA